MPQRVVAYRATSRFFLRLSGSVPPNRCPSPKARSRPASAYRPSRRHVGGTGSKDVLLDTRILGRLRKSAKGRVFRTNLRLSGKSAAGMAARTALRARLIDRHAALSAATISRCYNIGFLRVSDSAAITPLARTQQRLPMVSPQPLKRLGTGAAFHLPMVPTTTGELSMAGSGG